MNAVKTIGEISAESMALAARLRQLSIGETIKYADLSSIAGRDVQQHRGSLRTARRALKREGILTEPVRGFGIQRCNGGDQVIAKGRSQLKRAGSAIREGQRVMGSCLTDYDKLPREKQVEANVVSTMLNTMSVLCNSKTERSIESKLTTPGVQLDLSETLNALGS